MTARTGKPILWCFSRFPFFLLPPGERRGQTCLFGLICKGREGNGLQKPELERGTAKRICILRK